MLCDEDLFSVVRRIIKAQHKNIAANRPKLQLRIS